MLETNDMSSKNAYEDIECFKMVYKKSDDKCVSYVMGYEYTLGEENIPIKVETDQTLYKDVDGEKFLVVREGYHSYARKEDIQPCNKTVIVRCIIPAGSQYFVDTYKKHYVSSNIIIKEYIKKD